MIQLDERRHRDLGDDAPVLAGIDTQKRAAFVQFGDFAAAAVRWLHNEPSQYYAQDYSVDAVVQLARRGMAVMVIGLGAAEPKDVEVAGVRVVNRAGRLDSAGDVLEVAALLRQWGASDVIMRTPSGELAAACGGRTRVLPLLADSFARSWRGWWRRRALARALAGPGRWVANHQRGACADLVRIGVPAGRVLPWDWPASHSPEQAAVRGAPADPAAPRLLYAGRLAAGKGLGDLIEAVALLRKRGRRAELTVAGGGDAGPFEAMAQRGGAAAAVHFLGVLPHERVVSLACEHDIMVVPSRHAYPEGLPMTIYDALATRTPLVASDHPMFRQVLRDGETAVIFRAGRPAELAGAVQRLCDDGDLGRRLSTHSLPAWRQLQQVMKWRTLVYRWLRDAADDAAFFARHCLNPVP